MFLLKNNSLSLGSPPVESMCKMLRQRPNLHPLISIVGKPVQESNALRHPRKLRSRWAAEAAINSWCSLLHSEWCILSHGSRSAAGTGLPEHDGSERVGLESV